jgi:hypothetical protein
MSTCKKQQMHGLTDATEKVHSKTILTWHAVDDIIIFFPMKRCLCCSSSSSMFKWQVVIGIDPEDTLRKNNHFSISNCVIISHNLGFSLTEASISKSITTWKRSCKIICCWLPNNCTGTIIFVSWKSFRSGVKRIYQISFQSIKPFFLLPFSRKVE